jgi:His-Xaa-Ser system protein HxsD
VNAEIYSKETIFAVGYVFLDKAYILLDTDKNNIVIYLYPQQKDMDLKKLCLEFCNELLNYAHYFSRAEKNAEAIKVIMQRALFSAAPSLVQDAEEKEIEDLITELEEEEQNGEDGHGAKDATALEG